MNKQKRAFTLVELIVTLTIIAILGTIAFISLQGYSKSARDSSRITDLSTMKTGLELFYLDAGKYPETTGGIPILLSGSTIWNQGVFGNQTKVNISKLDRIPVDPLTSKEYTYSITSNRQEYQLAGISEGTNNITQNQPNILKANADNSIATAYITGNYNGKMFKDINGNECKILGLPSIISSDLSTGDLENIINNGYLVYNGYNNLPSNYANTKFKIDGGFDFKPSIENFIAYSDSDSCSTLFSNTEAGEIERYKLFEGLQNSYSGSTLETNENLSSFFTLNASEGKEYIGYFFNNVFGTEIIEDSSGAITTFDLEFYTISDFETISITNNCLIPPTSYTSSNTSIATISGDTISGIGAGTTTITPVGGDCDNSEGKTLTVVHVQPTWPFDLLTASTTFKYDNNSSWGNAVFQGYGEHNGHKTVKLYIPNGVAGFGVPLGENMSITKFYYTLNSGGTANLAVNQVPSDGDARVYNAQGAFYTSALAENGKWKSTEFFDDKVLNTDFIYISSQGGDPFTVEFYVTTGLFEINKSLIPFYKTATITDSCINSPTSYESSDNSVATVVGNTVYGVSEGTVTITPTSGTCTDMNGKEIEVIGIPPTDFVYPFDNLVEGRDENYFIYDLNSNYSNTIFQGYGEHNGHKTIKLRIPNGVAGFGIPLLGNISIKEFHYTLNSAGTATLAVNQVPSDGYSRVYNAQGDFYSSAIAENGVWKSTEFYDNKVLNTGYIYISSQGGDPFDVEFYVNTGVFSLNTDSIIFYKTATIKDSCIVSPTSYESLNSSVATISGNTIYGVSEGTTTIKPTSGTCADMDGKIISVTGIPPSNYSYPFDNLIESRDENYFIYDLNSNYSNSVFQGYGEYNGHKTIKLYIPNTVAGFGIPLLGNVSIENFTYKLTTGTTGTLAVNQVPSDGYSRVYNAQGAFYTSAIAENGVRKTTYFFEDKVLTGDYIYISSQGGDPFTVEFYVSTQ